jgi:hypothetical protein
MPSLYTWAVYTGMVCTWRPLLEKFSILLWQARVGRQIERYKNGRGNEKAAGGDDKSS